MHSHRGSGAVIVSSRKTGFVNFGVSRESGGAVRALRNAGDTRVKRKRGDRSVAAIAARIERGYLKRTAGSTACVNNHGDSRGTISDGNGRPAAERTSTTARDGGDDTRTRKGKTRTASAEHGEHAKSARAGRRSRHMGDRKAMKYADWSFKQISYLGAVNQRYQEELMKTESSSTPRLNANLGGEESALSTQMHYILVMTTAGAALDKCHNAGVNEGFEAWRQFVMEWEPKLRTRYVGL